MDMDIEAANPHNENAWERILEVLLETGQMD